MARLPSEIDLQRRPAPAQTPDIRAPAIDYDPVRKAAKESGAGLGEVGKALSAFAEAAGKAESNDLERKLVDFRLDTEMELERRKREMPAGGEGYASSWLDTYRDKAKEFVGEKYSNIPPQMRAQVDLALKKHEAVLVERATRDEYAEKDRATLAGLEDTLGKTRSAVEADPSRLDEMHATGRRLIEGAALTPAMKSAFAKKYREALEEGAASTVADRVTDAESYARAKEMLAPHKAERVTAKGVAAAIKADPAGRIDPVAFAERMREKVAASPLNGQSPEWAKKFGVDGSPESWARFFTMLQQQESGHRTAETNADGSLKRFPTTPRGEQSYGPGQFKPGEYGLKTWADVNDPEKVADAYIEVAKQGKVTAYFGSVQRPNETLQHGRWYDTTVRPKIGTSAGADVSPDTTDAEAYAGPYQNLSLAKRRAIWGRAEANFDKVKKGTEAIIAEQMKVAADGFLPPEPVLQELERRVRAIGDPMLAAKYDSMLRNAQWTQRLQKAPPLAGEEVLRQMRDQAAANGATKETDEAIKHVEKVVGAVRKSVNDDPMTWAARTGIEAPLQAPDGLSFEQMDAYQPQRAPIKLDRLDFSSQGIGEQLAVRMDQAKRVGAYYGQPPQVFTKIERDFLKDTLRQGGRGMLGVMGQISDAARAAGVEPADVMKEFSKSDAPELAVIGQMVAAKGDPAILNTAAKALSWKAKQGEKFESMIDKAQAKPDLEDYRDVLASSPTQVDAVKHTANLIYEYEHRQRGLKEFDATVYRNVVRRVMGETSTPEGVVYGGVGQQGTGWTDGKWKSAGWFGKTPKVLVPPEVKQDSFDDMVAHVKMADLGDNLPRDGAGRALSIGQVRSSAWVSLDVGRYVLELKRDADGNRVVALNGDGTPYVLDVRPILPAIRRRVPEIFKGYDGVSKGVVESDPMPITSQPEAPAQVMAP